jgi:hypothetical protein
MVEVTCRPACRRRRTSLPTGTLPAGDPGAHPAYPGRPRGPPGHCPTTSQDDGQVQADASAGPAQPAPASSAGSDSGRPRAGRGRGGRPRRPRPSQPCGGLPPAALPDLTSVGHSGRATHRHRRPHRTADTGTLRRPHRTLDTGHMDSQAWTLVARTGHRTPDAGRRTPDAGRRRLAEDADRVTRARPASDPWATTPSDRPLGRPTVLLWTALRRSAAHAGSAVRPPSSARLPLALPASCSVAPPGPSRASAHCSPRTITGRA